MLELNAENFKEVINSDKPVLVDFWAEWCAPCRAIAPALEELEKQYGDKVKFAKLNVDENTEIATEYNIASIPTLVIFKNGQEVDRMIGAAPKSKIEDFIKRNL